MQATATGVLMTAMAAAVGAAAATQAAVTQAAVTLAVTLAAATATAVAPVMMEQLLLTHQAATGLSLGLQQTAAGSSPSTKGLQASSQ